MYDDDDDAPPAEGTVAGKTPQQWAKHWAGELARFRKWATKFHKTAAECERAFEDERDQYDQQLAKTNLFWANTQVVLSAIYARLPSAEVERRYKDQNDDVSRVASEILQRILNNDIEREHDDTDASIRDALQDRFVVGLGQCWVRYDVETTTEQQPVIDPVTGAQRLDENGQPMTQPVEVILTEEAEVDYVYWRDFAYSPARRWRNVTWVARRVPMTRRELRARFGLSEQQARMVPQAAPERDRREDDPHKGSGCTMVWEIWDKPSNHAFWFVEGMDTVLDARADPLQLDGFFPCPMPCVATTPTRAFLPKADYRMAQDLYRELDDINARLGVMERALRVAGVYDRNNDGVRRLLTENVVNELIPVENWGALSEKGGLKGAIDWFPIDQVAATINELTRRKQQVQQDLFEVLGISDIMRGSSDPNETATAQNYKVQYGGARLGNIQARVARFVSAIAALRAEVICRHFQPETIIARSQIARSNDAALIQPAVELLKSADMAALSIKVSGDTLEATDWRREQETRTQFLSAVSGYLQQTYPVAQADPQAGVVLLQLLQWAVAGFKGSRTIEGVIDQAVTALQQQAQQPPAPEEPSPQDKKQLAEAERAGAQAEKTRAEAQLMQLPMPMPTPPAQPTPMQPMPVPPMPVPPAPPTFS